MSLYVSDIPPADLKTICEKTYTEEVFGTHRLPVTEFKAGFEIMRTGKCGKIVLDWKA